ncbi:MAG: hypothetical protein WC760_06650 [Bacteroidia bacterium]
MKKVKLNITMKTIKIVIAFLLILSSLSFKIFDNKLDECLIKEGETIEFSNKLSSKIIKTSMSLKMGSYDGSGFECRIDTANNIIINDITSSDGPRQDNFIIVGCTGSLTRVEENLVITFEKCRKTYYLISLDGAGLVGEFDTIKRIVLKSEKLTGGPAEFFCSEKDNTGVRFKKTIPKNKDSIKEQEEQTDDDRVNSTIHLRAVPSGIKKEELYAARHAPQTLAQFTKIEVETLDGEIKSFPQGSYILCEGNTLLLK